MINKVKAHKYLYFVLIIIFLTIIGVSIFYLLGGMDERKVYKLGPVKRSVAGKFFATRYTDDELREFGMRCKEIISSKEMDGILTSVTYQSDTLEQKEIVQFIGITLSEDMAEIPAGFEVREFTSGARYAVFLSMHPLVRPWPKTIENLLYEKARTDGKELDNFFFELHYEDNSLSVEAWVKEEVE